MTSLRGVTRARKQSSRKVQSKVQSEQSVSKVQCIISRAGKIFKTPGQIKAKNIQL